MNLSVRIGNLKITPPFLIPSGIVTTTLDTCKLIAKSVEVGAVVTKSIGAKRREGNLEPILAQLSKDTFINAVGLSNPGYKEFVKELKEMYPLKKPLIVSIFGKDEQEFVKIAKALANYSDALELNVSCPHAKGYGASIGQDPELTHNITKSVKESTNIPIIVKLTPNVKDIKIIARKVESVGADAIAAINTVGPKTNSILSNKLGGVSGKGIKSIGLKCVKEIKETVRIPIIGIGGIETAGDVVEYFRVGANVVGIGTALRGMGTKQINDYFHFLKQDVTDLLKGKKADRAEKFIYRSFLMKYEDFKLTEIKERGKDLKIFYFDKPINAEPGQFVFLMIPEKGEKPFSVADNEPLILVVRKVGYFTSELFKLREGEKVKIRGAYGNSFPMNSHLTENCYLVAGGTGVAPLHLLAKRLKQRNLNITTFLGAKTESEVLFESEFKNFGKVEVATEDGSKGYKGLVTDLLNQWLSSNSSVNPYFFNCGPELMIKGAIDAEKKYTNPERILNAIERYMRCSIGLCGSCSCSGYRTCVDGPVFTAEQLKNMSEFGKYKRDKSGERVSL